MPSMLSQLGEASPPEHLFPPIEQPGRQGKWWDSDPAPRRTFHLRQDGSAHYHHYQHHLFWEERMCNFSCSTTGVAQRQNSLSVKCYFLKEKC